VGIATLYVVYLGWTAMASHPDKECNDLIDSGVNTFLQILIGTIFCAANLWSIAIATAEPNDGKSKETMGQNIIEEDESESKPTTPENEEAALFVVTFQTMFF